jgi:hypothetical protein
MATRGAERSTHETGSRAAVGVPGELNGADVDRGTPRTVPVPRLRVARDFRRDRRE